MGKALIALQMFAGMPCLPAGGELIPGGGWRRTAPGLLVSGINPQARGFDLVLSATFALLQQLDCGVVYYPAGDCAAICREGMKMACPAST